MIGSTRAVQRVVLDRLIDLAESSRASSDARATADSKLRDLALHLDSRSVQVGVELAHVEEALRRIIAFLERPHPELRARRPLPHRQEHRSETNRYSRKRSRRRIQNEPTSHTFHRTMG